MYIGNNFFYVGKKGKKYPTKLNFSEKADVYMAIHGKNIRFIVNLTQTLVRPFFGFFLDPDWLFSLKPSGRPDLTSMFESFQHV